MSEKTPEITEAEARLLDELADLHESDPAGYRALVEGASVRGEAEVDPEKAHAEWILEALADKRQQEDPLFLAFQEAWRQAASAQAAQEDSQ